MTSPWRALLIAVAVGAVAGGLAAVWMAALLAHSIEIVFGGVQ